MDHSNKTRRLNLEAAQSRIDEISARLTALRQNPEVNGHAADDYIKEATELLSAAKVDIEAAKESIRKSQ